MRTLFLTLITSLFVLPAHAKYSGGTGEPNDPYQIATADDLILLGETPEDYDKHLILTADIDLDPNLPGRKVFNKAVIAPDTDPLKIYSQGAFFNGSFDGNWHTISNLMIKGEDYLGLFGHVIHPAQVRRLGVVNVNISGSGDYIGGLAGSYDGSINTSYSNGSVSGNNYVGGLAGASNGSIMHCYSAGEITGAGYNIGGLVGNSSDVTGCYFIGTVVGGDGVGGLVGSSNGGISTSFSTGPVNGNRSVGGLVGATKWNRTVNGCFWNIETSGQVTNREGMGCSTAEMQTAATFLEAGWDFMDETANGTEDIWKIAEDLGYPRLWWEKYSGGTGEPNAPYQIATAADLIALGETPADYDKHFILTTDIDLDPNLPGRKVFDKAVIAPDTDPVKFYYQGVPFTGVFDGNGYPIRHLTVRGTHHLGLFGELRWGEIKDIALLDVSITGSDSLPDAQDIGCTGGLAGVNDGGTVTDCCSTGTITGSSLIGGLIGTNNGTVARCYATGTVRGTDFVGGLVGNNDNTVTNCYSTGAVSGKESVGGLVGLNFGTVTQCFSTGSVSGDWSVGGLVGSNVVGYVSHCYSTGAVSGTDAVGGLVGNGDLNYTESSCFWDIDTSGQSTSCGGVGKTSVEMQKAGTFLDAGWDFVGEGENGLHETWQMPDGGGCPVLAVFNGYAPPQLQGEGTRENPYLISNALELGAMAYHSPSAHYRLTDSIDLSGICWSLAVVPWPWFGGTFDGNGLTISHLTMEGEGQFLGLFSQLAHTAEVRDLGLVDVSITGGSRSSVGGLVGYSNGDLIRCYTTGLVVGRSDCVGGLVGFYGEGDLGDCYSTAHVVGTEGACDDCPVGCVDTGSDGAGR